MTTMRISFDHSACSYGDAVLLDDAGTPHKWGDLGMTHDDWRQMVQLAQLTGSTEVEIGSPLVTKP